MAAFIQFPQQQANQDPDAIRRAMLARIFGMQPPRDSNAQPKSPGPAAAQPAAAAPPDPNAPKPTATPTTGTEPSSQPPAAVAAPHVLSEEEYAKQNPAAPHAPYQEPDLKHRMLMGLFAGLQNFGRDPGAGERMLGNYLGDIQKNEQAEANYPQTAAAAAHKSYMDYLAGQAGPLNIEDLQAQINQRQAAARDAAAKANAPPRPENLQQMHADALADALKRGVKPSEDPHVLAIEDAIQRVQKEPAQKTQNDFEQYYGQWLKDNKQQDTAANRLQAHKDWEIKPEQPGANDTRMDRSYTYNNNIVEKQRASIDQRLERLDRVEQAVAQHSAQADALIAPELLSVMVGGQGSGLRMNEAEISRIVGGRSHWANLQAALQKWVPGNALSVTPAQREEISALLKVVRQKTEAKQRAFDEAQEGLIHAGSVEEHRKITGDLKKKLSAIDSGAGGGKEGEMANPQNPLGI